MSTENEIKVWDLFVRVSHWTLLVAFVVCYVTEGKPRWLHVNSGYIITALVVSRIIWGFIGPRHARFSDFLRRPGEILAHLKDVALGRAKSYLGHDPAGGAMIVVLLLVLSSTVLSGMLLYGAEDKAGPFAGWTAEIGGEFQVLSSTALASRGDKEWEQDRPKGRKDPRAKWLEEVHELLANVALTLAVIHLCGVLTVSFETRENLILSMITGRKKNIDHS